MLEKLFKIYKNNPQLAIKLGTKYCNKTDGFVKKLFKLMLYSCDKYILSIGNTSFDYYLLDRKIYDELLQFITVHTTHIRIYIRKGSYIQNKCMGDIINNLRGKCNVDVIILEYDKKIFEFDFTNVILVIDINRPKFRFRPYIYNINGTPNKILVQKMHVWSIVNCNKCDVVYIYNVLPILTKINIQISTLVLSDDISTNSNRVHKFKKHIKKFSGSKIHRLCYGNF